MRNLGKALALMMIGILAVGCYSSRVNRFETAAYQSASPENKLRIEQGKIEAGMSVEEGKVSRPDCQFINKFTSSDGSYELWEVRDSQEKGLYLLHVENGRIAKVSGYVEPKKTKSRGK